MRAAMTAEPTLVDVFRMMWAARLHVIAGGVAGVSLAFIILAFAVPHYRVSMLLAPAERAAQADVKALLPDNPSFALQYLVNTMGSQDSTDFIRFEHTMREPSVAATIMNDSRIQDGLREERRFSFLKGRVPESAAELSAVLEKEIKIEPVGNTPLRKVIIDHPSGDFGAYLLRRLYEETDHMIRAEVADKAKNRAAYLNDMLGKVHHPDHRRALTSLLMEQEHILMILAMDEPFAAIIAEPPSVSPRPWWPRKTLFLSVFLLAGMLAGFAFHGLRRAT